MKTSKVAEQQHAEQEQRACTLHSLALVVVCLAIFLDALDVSIVTIALPNIKRDLQLTTTELQWVSGIYLLVYAGFQLLGGVLLICLASQEKLRYACRLLLTFP